MALRASQSQVCVNYCPIKQDEQTDQDSDCEGDDDEEEDRRQQAMRRKQAKYRDYKKTKKKKKKKLNLNHLSGNERARIIMLICSFALTISVIKCFSQLAVCDNVATMTNFYTKQNSSLAQVGELINQSKPPALIAAGPAEPEPDQQKETQPNLRLFRRHPNRGPVVRRRAREPPLYLARENERVELACHMFGAQLEQSRDRKWLGLVDSSANLLDGTNESLLGDEDDKRPNYARQNDLDGFGLNLERASEQANKQKSAPDNSAANHVLPDVDVDLKVGLSEEAALNEQDLVSLVFWFKDDNPTPIYTLDARQVQVNAPFERSHQASNLPSLASKKEAKSERFSELDKSQLGQANNTANHYNNEPNQRDNNKDHEGTSEEHNSERAKLMHMNRRLLSGARHYPSKRELNSSTGSGSLKLDPTSSFPVLKLIIEGVGPRDSGNYKCRVDFRRSSTVSQLMRLLVEVPISGVEISIAQATLERSAGFEASPGSAFGIGVEVRTSEISGKPISATTSGQSDLSPPGVLLDENENESGEFMCFVAEGSPPPSLTWLVSFPLEGAGGWSESLLASSQAGLSVQTVTSSEQLSRQNLVASSRLNVKGLERRFHRARFTCRAVQLQHQHQQLTTSRRPLSDPFRGSEEKYKESFHSGATINYRQSSSIRENLGKKKNSPSANSTSDVANSTQALTDLATILPLSNIGKIVARQGNSSTSKPNWRTSMIDDFLEDSQRWRAKNNELSKWFELRLNLKPTNIEIVSDLILPTNKPTLTAQGPLYLAEVAEFALARFVCSSRGSNPVAQIEWSLREPNGQLRNLNQTDLHAEVKIKRSSQVASETSSASSSTLEISAIARHYHLAEFTCKATNEKLPISRPDRSLSARVKLSVKSKQTPPVEAQVRLVTAHDELEGNREEWKSRRLKCLVRSNPPINQLVWLVNEQPLAKIMAPTRNKEEFHFLPDNAETTGTASARKRPNQSELLANVHNIENASNVHPRPMQEEDKTNFDLDTEAESKHGQEVADIVPNKEWTFVPLISSAIDESKYRFRANSLTVMNLKAPATNNNELVQSYKCIAISALGEATSSSSLRLSHNYAPTCSREDTTTTTNKEADSVIDLSLDRSTQVDDLWARFTCHVDANPASTSFTWSFVPLDRVAKLIAQPMGVRTPPRKQEFNPEGSLANQEQRELHQKLLNAASFHKETNSSEISYFELVKNLNSTVRESRPRGGLLLCLAQNRIGPQAKPCLNLLLPPDLTVPDAANCTVEPLLESRLSTDQDQHQHQQYSRHIAISVDCSRTRDSDRLLFQLSISRRSNDSNKPTENHLSKRRLLFTQSKLESLNQTNAGQERSRFSISDLLDWDQKWADSANETPDEATQDDQASLAASLEENAQAGAAKLDHAKLAAKRGRSESTTGSKLITLDEQVDLLKELVFTIRASNLLRTSPPHAIYGSQLKLGNAEFTSSLGQQPVGDLPLFSSASGAAQVSRSTNQVENSDENVPLSHITLAGVVSGNSSIRVKAGAQNTPTSWIHHHEITITIGAIFGTFVLSLLTLTLIILVLKGRKEVQITTRVKDNDSLSRIRPKSSRSSASEQLELRESFDEKLLEALALKNNENNHSNNEFYAKLGKSDDWTTTLPVPEATNSHYSSKIKLNEIKQQGVNFLAPAVCNGSLKVARRYSTMNKQAANTPMYTESHLSLSQLHDSSELGSQRTVPTILDFNYKDTLYVIDNHQLADITSSEAPKGEFRHALGGSSISLAGHNLLEVEHSLESNPTSHRHITSCSESRKLLDNEQTLNGHLQHSYCSPSTCNSSLGTHYDEQSLSATTSEQVNFAQGSTQLNRNVSRPVQIACLDHHQVVPQSFICAATKNQQIWIEDEDVISGGANTTTTAESTTTTTTGAEDCLQVASCDPKGRPEVELDQDLGCNNMYLFSFL